MHMQYPQEPLGGNSLDFQAELHLMKRRRMMTSHCLVTINKHVTCNLTLPVQRPRQFRPSFFSTVIICTRVAIGLIQNYGKRSQRGYTDACATGVCLGSKGNSVNKRGALSTESVSVCYLAFRLFIVIPTRVDNLCF